MGPPRLTFNLPWRATEEENIPTPKRADGSEWLGDSDPSEADSSEADEIVSPPRSRPTKIQMEGPEPSESGSSDGDEVNSAPPQHVEGSAQEPVAEEAVQDVTNGDEFRPGPGRYFMSGALSPPSHHNSETSETAPSEYFYDSPEEDEFRPGLTLDSDGSGRGSSEGGQKDAQLAENDRLREPSLGYREESIVPTTPQPLQRPPPLGEAEISVLMDAISALEKTTEKLKENNSHLGRRLTTVEMECPPMYEINEMFEARTQQMMGQLAELQQKLHAPENNISGLETGNLFAALHNDLDAMKKDYLTVSEMDDMLNKGTQPLQDQLAKLQQKVGAFENDKSDIEKLKEDYAHLEKTVNVMVLKNPAPNDPNKRNEVRAEHLEDQLAILKAKNACLEEIVSTVKIQCPSIDQMNEMFQTQTHQLKIQLAKLQRKVDAYDDMVINRIFSGELENDRKSDDGVSKSDEPRPEAKASKVDTNDEVSESDVPRPEAKASKVHANAVTSEAAQETVNLTYTCLRNTYFTLRHMQPVPPSSIDYLNRINIRDGILPNKGTICRLTKDIQGSTALLLEHVRQMRAYHDLETVRHRDLEKARSHDLEAARASVAMLRQQIRDIHAAHEEKIKSVHRTVDDERARMRSEVELLGADKIRDRDQIERLVLLKQGCQNALRAADNNRATLLMLFELREITLRDSEATIERLTREKSIADKKMAEMRNLLFILKTQLAESDAAYVKSLHSETGAIPARGGWPTRVAPGGTTSELASEKADNPYRLQIAQLQDSNAKVVQELVNAKVELGKTKTELNQVRATTNDKVEAEGSRARSLLKIYEGQIKYAVAELAKKRCAKCGEKAEEGEKRNGDSERAHPMAAPNPGADFKQSPLQQTTETMVPRPHPATPIHQRWTVNQYPLPTMSYTATELCANGQGAAQPPMKTHDAISMICVAIGTLAAMLIIVLYDEVEVLSALQCAVGVLASFSLFLFGMALDALCEKRGLASIFDRDWREDPPTLLGPFTFLVVVNLGLVLLHTLTGDFWQSVGYLTIVLLVVCCGYMCRVMGEEVELECPVAWDECRYGPVEAFALKEDLEEDELGQCIDMSTVKFDRQRYEALRAARDKTANEETAKEKAQREIDEKLREVALWPYHFVLRTLGFE